VIARITHRVASAAIARLRRAALSGGANRTLSFVLAVASTTALAHAQLKDSSNQTSCLRMSQLQYLQTLEQECHHLALAADFTEILSSWHRACYLGRAPNRQSEDYIRWHTSNRSQQDQICRDALDALKRNPRHFDGLLLYRR